jgi:hypothetical protein
MARPINSKDKQPRPNKYGHRIKTQTVTIRVPYFQQSFFRELFTRLAKQLSESSILYAKFQEKEKVNTFNFEQFVNNEQPFKD